MREALLGGGHAAIVVRAALYGMGGVGKTQLALKYSHEYRDSYAGVWWFRAESDKTLQLDARDACLQAGAPLVDGEPTAATFKRWLGWQEQPWLLVFDNAESAEALRSHLPQGGPHHVLITSRDPAWGGVARPIQLAVWSDEEGANFLAARLPAAGRGNLQRLSGTLGGLQLALEQAAAFLEHTGGAVAEYCTQIEGVDTAAFVLDQGRASTGYESSVLATLSVAFPRLSAAAQQLLRVCAFFSAEPIPERYFREGIDHLSEPLASTARRGLAWESTVGELRHFGIVERVDVAALDRAPGQADERVEKEKALVLHRLTLEVARHALSAPAEDGLRAQKLLRAHCPHEADDPRRWPRFAALLPHLLNLERMSSQGWLDRRAHIWMLDRVATYLRSGKALHQESERLFRSALNLNKAHFGEEDPDTLTLMNNLAGTLSAQGDLAGARALQEQVLSIDRRVLGEEHPSTLTSMNTLATTLLAQGDLAGARALQEQVLPIRGRVLGEEHPSTLTSMNNLAETLSAQGDLAGARALQEQVLSIDRRALGEEHRNTLGSMNNLAATLLAQGDLAGARALQEQVLSINRRVLGEEHPSTLMSMSNLAHTLRAQGDLNRACTLAERALAISQRVVGEEHPNTLTLMANLAATLSEQGNLTGARALDERVLSISRRVLGEEHPKTLTAMNNLAGTLWAQGDSTGARELQEQVLSISRRVLGEEHPDTLMSMNNLALTLRAQRDLASARALQEEVLLIRRRVLAEEHPHTLASMHDLAITLWQMGAGDEAATLMAAAVEGRLSKLGAEHPGTKASLDALTAMRAAGSQM